MTMLWSLWSCLRVLKLSLPLHMWKLIYNLYISYKLWICGFCKITVNWIEIKSKNKEIKVHVSTYISLFHFSLRAMIKYSQYFFYCKSRPTHVIANGWETRKSDVSSHLSHNFMILIIDFIQFASCLIVFCIFDFTIDKRDASIWPLFNLKIIKICSLITYAQSYSIKIIISFWKIIYWSIRHKNLTTN